MNHFKTDKLIKYSKKSKEQREKENLDWLLSPIKKYKKPKPNLDKYYLYLQAK